jgi:hypothetical protein
MTPKHRELEHLKRELSGPPTDFSAAFLKVQELRRLVDEAPDAVDHGTVRLLHRLLIHEPYQAQRQAYFFSRETALVLRDVLEKCPRLDVTEHARRALERLSMETQGACQRAACEALGALPLPVAPPLLPSEPDPIRAPLVSLNHIGLREEIGGAFSSWNRCGRSLWIRQPNTGRLLTIKTAADPDGARALFREIQWMRILSENADLLEGDGSSLPRPLYPYGPSLFRLKSAGENAHVFESHTEGRLWAIAFSAPPDYFVYPNQPINGRMPSKATFLAALRRSARVLGRLASYGIVHTAPIPLFHNRVQRHRREDGGLYRWPRGGRLDRWLESCDYPNFGQSGIRDLEHLEPAGTHGMPLHEQIGMHFLSFLLVAGSYFRNRDRGLRGRKEDGTPVDVRDWFDENFLVKVIESVFKAYYEAFTGWPAPTDVPWNLARLARRMIDEMGVDRHMEEILRVADQENMSDDEFRAFLEERGKSPEEASRFTRGKEDIVLLTGPHLGAFNDRISLPEIIHFVGSAAALCISGRYFRLRSRTSTPPCVVFHRPDLSR